VTEPARGPAPPLPEDTPSLDPLAIERAYRRERARRRARIERRHAARRSGLRFWLTILVLLFFAAVVILAAWQQVQSLFGV
jgi:cell division septal protein FtsQ